MKTRVEWSLGLLVQTPRAALLADQLAGTARWFCFDLRELTRCLFGLDREEVAAPDALRGICPGLKWVAPLGPRTAARSRSSGDEFNRGLRGSRG